MTYNLLKRKDLQKVLSPVNYFKYLYLQQNMCARMSVFECVSLCVCVCVCVLVFVVYEDISYEYTPHYEDILNYDDRVGVLIIQTT